MMVPLSLNSAVKEVNVRLPTPDDKDLPWFDNTTLVAINTCPTYGMIRNVNDLAMPGGGRAMALEAGSASHEFYAAVRIYELIVTRDLPVHALVCAKRLFKDETVEKMYGHLGRGEDERVTGMNFCLEALYSSGFYNNPDD